MKILNNITRRSVSSLFAALILMLFVCAAQAQTTAFTYQGRFADSTVAQTTNGTYTMNFRLHDAATNGNQIPNSSTSVTAMVSVVNSIFTTRLDFGAAAFNTTGARYLEIQVGSTFLTPRQEVTLTPFSQRALNAANADKLGGVAVNQYVQKNDSRLSDSRTPTAGSNNYVQNTTTQQSANFNVSGNGIVGGTLTTNKIAVNSVLARGGAPGINGVSNNGYAFSGNGGDNDSGLFSTANGRVSLYADNIERAWVDSTGLTVTETINGTLANGIVTTSSLAALPNCRARQMAAQTFTNGLFLTVLLDDTQFCSGVTFDNANDRLVIQTASVYSVSTDILFASNATGLQLLSLNSNGNSEFSYSTTNGVNGVETGVTVTELIRLNIGDSVSVLGAQTSGGNFNSSIYNGRSASLSVVWVSP